MEEQETNETKELFISYFFGFGYVGYKLCLTKVIASDVDSVFLCRKRKSVCLRDCSLVSTFFCRDLCAFLMNVRESS